MFKWLRERRPEASLERRADLLERANAEFRAGNAQLEADMLGRANEDDRRWAEVFGRLETLELKGSVPGVMAFAARARLERMPLVSVITPTVERADLLARAIDSVRGQTYENWELIVIGDPEGVAVADRVGDPRIRTVARSGPGVCRARNAGLDVASGELIAYLDDDNLMDQGWLRTVVWGLDRHRDADVVYGGYVIEDVAAVNDVEGGGPPGLILNRFSHDRLADANPADASAVAHRAGLAEARFDESLIRLGDWEQLARLTAHRDPLMIPAIACYYSTAAADRLSLEPPTEREFEAVRRAVARRSEAQPKR